MLFDLAKQYPGICLGYAVELLGRSRSFIYKSYDILRGQGRIDVVKGKSKYRDGPRTTLLYVSEVCDD